MRRVPPTTLSPKLTVTATAKSSPRAGRFARPPRPRPPMNSAKMSSAEKPWSPAAALVVPAEMEFAVGIFLARAAKAEGIAAKAARAWIEAAGIAAGVDLAGIEFGALVLVADNVIGGRRFPGSASSRLIAGMGVGMMLLGQAAERLLDFGLAGGLGHAQDLIRIAHHFRLWIRHPI